MRGCRFALAKCCSTGLSRLMQGHSPLSQSRADTQCAGARWLARVGRPPACRRAACSTMSWRWCAALMSTHRLPAPCLNGFTEADWHATSFLTIAETLQQTLQWGDVACRCALAKEPLSRWPHPHEVNSCKLDPGADVPSWPWQCTVWLTSNLLGACCHSRAARVGPCNALGESMGVVSATREHTFKLVLQ